MIETLRAWSRIACHIPVEKHRNVCSEYLWECNGTDCDFADAAGMPNLASCLWNHRHRQLPNIASHLISNDLHLPMREAATLSYSCWTVSLLRARGCSGRRDTTFMSSEASPLPLRSAEKSWIYARCFFPLFFFSHTHYRLLQFGSKQFFPCRKVRKKYRISKYPPKENKTHAVTKANF